MSMKVKKIGIIGCGAIGKALAKFIDRKLSDKAEIIALCDVDIDRAKDLVKLLNNSKPKVTGIDSLVRMSDLVVEAASAKISGKIVNKSINNGKDALIMSIGGLVLEYKELFKKARRKGVNIYLPSGAICGLDGIKALSLSKIKTVTLITRKPVKSLKGAEFFEKSKISLDKIKNEKTVFIGNAEQAIKNFSKNVNVAVLLSIAGLGAKKTRVMIVTSPKFKSNSHEIIIESEAGRIRTMCENVAFKENPKTSYLAALSAMTVLGGMFDSVKLGN